MFKSKKSSLGVGLEELLSSVNSTTKETSDIKGKGTEGIRKLGIDLLKPGKYQPRRNFKIESLEELANSIRSQGIIQPLLIRSVENGNYEIVAGERRWRAAQLAGLHEVPVIIQNISDRQAIAVSLIENIQREDLNAIDVALNLKRLIEEFSMTHEEASVAIGKSRTMVTNLLRLLGLPAEIKEMIVEGLVNMGHARAILTLDKAKQLAVAKIVIKKKLSVRECENLVKQFQQDIAVRLQYRSIDPNIRELQRQLSDRLGAKINILGSNGKNGKIIIYYNNLDELDGILNHIK